MIPHRWSGEHWIDGDLQRPDRGVKTPARPKNPRAGRDLEGEGLKFSRLFSVTLSAAIVAAAPFAAQHATGQGKAPLVKYKIVDEDSIPESLTGKPGDPEKGKKWSINTRLGHCIACHVMPVNQPYMGEVAPSLVGVGSRYSAGQLRMLIVNPKVVNEDTAMPAFYRVKGLHRVTKRFVNKTMLSAQQVEDIVAYLLTLKDTVKK